jgi:hypothetical protein
MATHNNFEDGGNNNGLVCVVLCFYLFMCVFNNYFFVFNNFIFNFCLCFIIFLIIILGMVWYVLHIATNNNDEDGGSGNGLVFVCLFVFFICFYFMIVLYLIFI